MSRREHRLSTRLAVVAAALVAVGVLVAGSVLLRFAERDLLAVQDRQLRDAARAVAPFAEQLRGGSVRPRVDALVDQRANRLGGGLWVEWPDGEQVSVGVVPDSAGTVLGRQPETLIDDDQEWRVFTVAVLDSGARLWVATPLDGINDQLTVMQRRIVAIAVLAAMAAGAAGLLVGRWLTRPLRVLQGRAAEISVGSPDERIWPVQRMPGDSGVAEVDSLAEALNDLLASRDAQQQRTEQALQSARSFSATAAHEPRTPMMSIQTNLEVLGHDELPVGPRAEILSDLRGELARMQELLGMLRALAQGELLDPTSFTTVDLADVADQAVDACRRRHPHARIRLDAPDELVVHGWAEGLRLVCDNLLTNAVVHGEPGLGPVAVELRSDHTGGAVLTVEDTGPGIPVAQRAVAFERFQRRPGSPGVGLGLTVTAQQVRLHGGTIELTDNPAGQGTRVAVRLPANGVGGDSPASL